MGRILRPTYGSRLSKMSRLFSVTSREVTLVAGFQIVVKPDPRRVVLQFGTTAFAGITLAFRPMGSTIPNGFMITLGLGGPFLWDVEQHFNFPQMGWEVSPNGLGGAIVICESIYIGG